MNVYERPVNDNLRLVVVETGKFSTSAYYFLFRVPPDWPIWFWSGMMDSLVAIHRLQRPDCLRWDRPEIFEHRVQEACYVGIKTESPSIGEPFGADESDSPVHFLLSVVCAPLLSQEAYVNWISLAPRKIARRKLRATSAIDPVTSSLLRFLDTDGDRWGDELLDRSFIVQQYDHLVRNASAFCYAIGTGDPAQNWKALQNWCGMRERQWADVTAANRERTGVDPNVPDSVPGAETSDSNLIILPYRLAAMNPSLSDRISLQVANALLGGCFHSKLISRIRRELGLAYFSFSVWDQTTGTLLMVAGAEPESRDQVREEMVGQLHALQRGDFTDRDLQVTKRFLVSDAWYTMDDFDSIVSCHLNRVETGEPFEPERRAALIHHVTKQDVMKAVSFLEPVMKGGVI
ncbi:insulinase family protein [Brevibacillus thermoruber]|uniref:insulinase family protein n=1 Tax=Brevibacillus thermoruber TaxID=33942 RepID=UPI0005547B0C|nr:insulinase family protein [Brevibacillus thermoruber]